MGRYILRDGKPVEITKETEDKARQALEEGGIDACQAVFDAAHGPANMPATAAPARRTKSKSE